MVEFLWHITQNPLHTNLNNPSPWPQLTPIYLYTRATLSQISAPGVVILLSRAYHPMLAVQITRKLIYNLLSIRVSVRIQMQPKAWSSKPKLKYNQQYIK